MPDDSYLAIAAIANDEFMTQRMLACATQQAQLGGTSLVMHGPNGTDPGDWVRLNNYLWASSPGWGDKWAYALNSGNAEPGKDAAVITDGDILATVQALTAPAE